MRCKSRPNAPRRNVDTSTPGMSQGHPSQRIPHAVAYPSCVITDLRTLSASDWSSGCLVYGDYGSQVVDETFEAKAPLPRVAWERELVALKDIDTVVVRPAWYVLSLVRLEHLCDRSADRRAFWVLLHFQGVRWQWKQVHQQFLAGECSG